MSRPLGLLVAGFNYNPVNADEFNAWYDTEHIPERLRVPGFLNAERWIGADDPKVSIATYDLRNLDVLRSPPYRAIAYENLSPWSKRMVGGCERICRFEGEQTVPGNLVAPREAEGLLLSAMNVDAAFEADFDAWYEEEHLPALSRIPGCMAARRFRVVSGALRYLALYHVSSLEVIASPAWDAAGTRWALELRPHLSDRLRVVLRRYRRSPA